MKRLIDNIARYILTVSGFTTSVVILLIIGFLFKEAVGLFNNPIVEDGYVLALNKENDVKSKSRTSSMRKSPTGKKWAERICPSPYSAWKTLTNITRKKN